MQRLARLLPIAAIVSAVTACNDSSSPVAPEPLPNLTAQLWHVHVSDGQPMPALVGHRTLPGNVLEQDFLDSARVEILDNGTWVLRGWGQRFRAGEFHSDLVLGDVGTWTPTRSTYEFRRTTGELLYEIPGPFGDSLQLNLRWPGQDGLAVSTLRRAPAPLAITGRWRANALRSQALPAAYIVEPNVDYGQGPVSRHIVIDSAFVQLYPNGAYVQRIYHTEWEGPANGDRTTPLGSFVEQDFGTWQRNGVALTLNSGWLQNKVMTGEVPAVDGGPLHLDHGITHGDPPATFRYQRW